MCVACMGLYIRGGYSRRRACGEHGEGFENEVEYWRVVDSDEYCKKNFILGTYCWNKYLVDVFGSSTL